MAVVSLLEARAARDKVIARVVKKNRTWVDDLRDFIPEHISTKAEITGEDIRILATEAGIVPTHPNAWGAAINALIKSGDLWPTEEYRQMAIKSSHARMTRVYIIRQ